MLRHHVLALAALLALGACSGCSFDASGLTFPEARAGDQAVDAAGDRGDLRAADGARLEQRVDLPLKPDQAPTCNPASCSGCCEGNTCRPGNQNELCGALGGNCLSCTATSQICGAGGVCGDCAKSSECSGNAVCFSKACVPPFSSPKWKVTIISAKVTSDNQGVDWDGGNKKPDPLVTFNIDAKLAVATTTKNDEYEPVWDETTYVPIAAASVLEFVVEDEDGSTDDLIGTVTLKGSQLLSVLKAGTYTGSDSTGGLSELKLAFEPSS